MRTPLAMCLGFSSVGISQSQWASALFTRLRGSLALALLVSFFFMPPILAQNASRLVAATGERFACLTDTERLSVIC
jgi:hypothetical protein